MKKLNSCDIAKLFLLSAVFLFSACENFIAGKVLKDELEKEIEYNRASPTTVTVSARPETLAQIVPTVGDYPYKKGDPITLRFIASDGYMFKYWEANPSNIIHFDNEKEVSTVAKLTEYADKVNIYPVCVKRPEVISFEPRNSDGVHYKNSHIKIEFDQELSEENDFSQIAVTMNGNSVKDSFFAPEWDRASKKILIRANTNLIDLKSETETISVKIPGTFYFIEDGQKVEMGKDKTFSYTINSSTNEKAEICFELDDKESGSLTYNQKTDNKYNIGEKINVNYKPAGDWVFFGWNIENGEKVVQLADDTELELKTTVEVLSQSVEPVRISPVTYKRPEASFGPEKNEAGVPKNSSVRIKFTKPLSETNELSKISITMDGVSILEHFEEPEWVDNGKEILFEANNENTINFTAGGTKSIIVKVPAEFYYEENGYKISFSEVQSYEYKINSKTNVTTKINFLLDDASSGKFTPSPPDEYNLGEYKSVNFVMDADTYRFKGWCCSNTKAVKLITEGIGVGYDNNGFNASTGVATAYFEILRPVDENDPVVIKPQVEKIPTMNIYAESKYGRFSQSISGSYKEGTVIPLNFTSDSDYQFIKWQIKNRNTKEEINNWTEESGGYIKIADLENTNTTFSLVQAAAADSNLELLIEPVCAKRPKVVSYSPQYSTEGDLRDRTLVVMFSTKMDESSIYYSGSELVELGVVNKNGSNYVAKSGYILLGSLVDGDCYGYYKDSDPDNSIVFKNIRICRLNNQDVNLLKYFEKPVFDKGNTGTLRIPTKITDLTNPDLSKRKDEAPPKNCEILVTLENGINYENNKSNVSLSEEFSWAYYTNTGTDAEPPEFSSIEIKKENDVSLLEFTDVEHSLIKDTDNIKTYNAKDGKIVFNLDVKDSGSGVGSVFATFTKINNEYYPTASGEDEKMETPVRFKLTGDKVSGSNNNKKLEEEIDLKDYGLDEGFYTVSLEAIDKNEHRAESKAFQFVYDNVPPKKVDNVPEKRLAEKETNLFWTKPEESDFAGVKVVSKNEDEDETRAPVIFARDSVPDVLTVKQLTPYKHYSHKIILSDYAGNETEINVKKDKDVPSTVDFSESRTSASESIISWSGVADDVGKLLVECYKDDSLHDKQVVDRNKTSVKFENLERGEKYKYKVTSYDYSGNPSETVFKQDDEGPAAATITGNTRTCSDKETITWTKSSSEDFDYVIVEQYDDDGETPKNSFKSMGNKDILSNEFTDLTNQTKYTYKITAVDYSGNQTVSDPYVDDAGPTLLIQNRDNIIRNSRTSPGEETITWNTDALITNENQGTDVDHVIVERWYSGSKKESFDDTGKTTTNTFTGLTNQEKYEYRFYSVDYSGNKSESYTTYLDGDGPDALVIRDYISNSRTSADEETITWTSDYLAGTDIDHIEIDQYEDTSLIRTFTLSSASSDTVTFEGLKNQHKYKYWFYSVDYSGNRSANYTEYEDNNGPESNVDIGIISNSRTSAETESVSWSADPTGNDVGGICIEQYDGSIRNNTVTYKVGSTKTANFAGMINQHKYKYRFYSLDYSGNKSTNYIEYQDDTPPAPLTIRYSGGRDGKVNVFFTTPSDEDYYITKVSWTIDGDRLDIDETTGINNSSYKTFNNGVNWTLYNYYFRTYDYSGNCSEPVYLQEMAGAMPGMICYAPGNDANNIFCSINYYEGMNPIGVVCDGQDQSKVQILALDESSSYVYGKKNGAFCEDNVWSDNLGYIWTSSGDKYFNNTDGIVWYQTVQREKYKDSMDGANGYNSIWYYLKNVKNKNSPVTWWIPARHEWANVGWNNVAVNTTLRLLKTKMSGVYEFSGIYFVSTPHFNHWRVNVVSTQGNRDDHINIVLVKNGNFEMRTTAYDGGETFNREEKYYFFTRAMAFVNME